MNKLGNQCVSSTTKKHISLNNNRLNRIEMLSATRITININQQLIDYQNGYGCTFDINATHSLTKTFTENPLGYLLFIDKHRHDETPFAPLMFDKENKDSPNSNYLKQAFLALDYTMHSNLYLNRTIDIIEFLDVLLNIISIALELPTDVDKSNILNLPQNTREAGLINPIAYADLYNQYSTNPIQLNHYNSHKIINHCCYMIIDVINELHPEVQSIIKIEPSLSNAIWCRYQTISEIYTYLLQYVIDYQIMIQKSYTLQEKIATIIIFASRLEAAHFFINANNRLMIILITKLLYESGLDPSIIHIPNGFSHFVLSCLPPELSTDENCTFNSLPLSRLVEFLDVPIKAIIDGQIFYQEIQNIYNENQAPRNNKFNCVIS